MGVDDLNPSFPETFDFPALQHDSGFEAIFDEKIVAGLFIQRDGVAVAGFILLLRHGRGLYRKDAASRDSLAMLLGKDWVMVELWLNDG